MVVVWRRHTGWAKMCVAQRDDELQRGGGAGLWSALCLGMGPARINLSSCLLSHRVVWNWPTNAVKFDELHFETLESHNKLVKQGGQGGSYSLGTTASGKPRNTVYYKEFCHQPSFPRNDCLFYLYNPHFLCLLCFLSVPVCGISCALVTEVAFENLFLLSDQSLSCKWISL